MVIVRPQPPPKHETVCEAAPDEDEAPLAPVPANGRRFAGRIATEYAYDVDHVHRPAVRLQLELPLRVGLESAWTHFIEPLMDGGLDRLTIGDANLTFRFAQSERAQFRAGLGARLMTDHLGTDAGFNFTYGFDLFPARPLVISGAFDLGNLGQAFVFAGRATVGAALGRVELYAGYDVLLVDPVLFHGPVAGVRIWF
jgi:hypothetical protein